MAQPTENLIDLTIVIPALNEEKRIGDTLIKLSKHLKDCKFFNSKKIEVLVVSADSIDKTHEIVKSKERLFVDNHSLNLLKPGPVVGKGRDVQYGVLRAKGKVIAYMDADMATPLRHIEEFYKEVEKGNDLVIGTRNLLSYRDNKFKNLLSYIGNMIYRLSSGNNIEDTQCGFKMLTGKAAGLCFSKLTIFNWGFDVELITIAIANNLKVKTIRLNDWEDKPYSTYNEKPLEIMKRMFRDYRIIKKNVKNGAYKENT